MAPLLGVAFLGTLAFSAFWSFVGIWAASNMHAGATAIGVMYALNAGAAAATAYIGGRVSDKIGRSRTIALALGLESLATLFLATVTRGWVTGMVLVVIAGAASGPVFAGTNALVADMKPESKREDAYGTLRVALNVGYMIGPPVGAMALMIGHWEALYVGVAIIGFASALLAIYTLPVVRKPSSQAEGTSLQGILHHTPFLLLLLSTFFGLMVYVAYEVILPIAMVTSYHIQAPTWGILATIDPVVVSLFQARFTRRIMATPVSYKMIMGLLLMGLPFLILLLGRTPIFIAMVVFIFAMGEMVWAPTSLGWATKLAPVGAQGAYMGAYAAAGSVAWAVAPFVDLHFRSILGIVLAWKATVVMSGLAAAFGLASTRTYQRRVAAASASRKTS